MIQSHFIVLLQEFLSLAEYTNIICYRSYANFIR